jgi:transcription elongation GreA/GreB family factor
MDKTIVHTAVAQEVSRRMNQLNALLQDAFDATANESKSSAGDKHETSRAMAQLEQEKIGGQLIEMTKLHQILQRIQPSFVSDSVQLGSLVETSNGWFYISVGIGVLNIAGNNLFCITPNAPVGKLLLGKKVQDSIEFNGNPTQILQLL